MAIRRVFVGTLALLALATPSLAGSSSPGSTALPGSPAVTENKLSGAASWEKVPDIGELTAIYPLRAINAHISGTSAMRCEVAKSGRLAHCRVVQETPAGWDFGMATLRAAQYYKLRPRTTTGASVEGSTIVVTLRWTPPVLG